MPSVQDEDDALSQELLETWLSPLWSSAHQHPAQNHWKPSAEAQHPSLGQVLSVQMCLGRLCVCVRARVHVCGQPGPCSAGLPCSRSCSVGLAVVLAPKA